jgi:hypothetical protein
VVAVAVTTRYGVLYVKDGWGREWAVPVIYAGATRKGNPDGPARDLVAIGRETGGSSVTEVVVLEESDGELGAADGLRGWGDGDDPPPIAADPGTAAEVGKEGDRGSEGSSAPVRGSTDGGPGPA